jgi:hypothetical protein
MLNLAGISGYEGYFFSTEMADLGFCSSFTFLG